jgi:phosphatidylglycerophosphatase A
MAVSPAQLRKQGLPIWKQIIVSGLYTGLSPIASGTVASAVAALIYFTPIGTNFLVLVACSLAAFAVGIPLARDAERVMGQDPGFVTIDEFAGQWLAMASPIFFTYDPTWIIVTFFMFRIFDIAKLWPASYFDRRSGGFSIMADDMVAAIYANVVSHLLFVGVAAVRGFLRM